MLTEPTAKNFLMSGSIDRVDDGAGIDNFAGLNLNLWHSLFPQMPLLVIDSDLIIQKRCVWSWRRHLNTTPVSDLLAEISSSLQVHGPTDAPESSEYDPLGHVSGYLTIRKREVRMVLIIFNHIGDTSPDESEERLETSDRCEVHDVI